VGIFSRQPRAVEDQTTGSSGQRDCRSFPTLGYFVPIDDEEMLEYESYTDRLVAEGQMLGSKGRAQRATQADLRVTKGPSREDRDNIPYIQEAWEWGVLVCKRLRMKPFDLRYGVVLDCLTRFRAAALIKHRNFVWPETAYKVVGLDVNRILAEHNAQPRDVWPKLEKVGDAVEANCCDDDWDGVVWGDVDVYDPARTIEVLEEDCDGCGKCVEALPDLFAMTSDDKAMVIDPKGVRDRDKEDRYLEAMGICQRVAIELDTRGATHPLLAPSPGKPLPGQLRKSEPRGE
jgi:ferredoxin